MGDAHSGDVGDEFPTQGVCVLGVTPGLGKRIRPALTEAGTGRPVLILHGGGGPFTVAGIANHLADTMHTITQPIQAGTAPPAPRGSSALTTSP